MRSYPLSSRKNTQGRGSCSTAFCMRLAWSRSGSSRPAADAAAARLGAPSHRELPARRRIRHAVLARRGHGVPPVGMAVVPLFDAREHRVHRALPSAGLMAKDSVARVTSPAIVFRCTMVSPGS